MVFALDLHVHTQRYSPCAETLAPEELVRVCKARGIGGVLLTEHDAMWTVAERDALAATAGGLVILRGAEVSCREGHFVVTGLDGLDGITKGIPAARLVEIVHARGGVVLLAHPYRDGLGPDGIVPASSVPPGIDGVEVLSTGSTRERAQYARALARDNGWLPVAGSDAHAIENVGAVVTVLSRPVTTEAELVEVVRAGEGVTVMRLDQWKERFVHVPDRDVRRDPGAPRGQ